MDVLNNIIDLRKRLQTPYVWNGFSKLLKNILTEAEESGATIDIATCRFGRDCIFQIEQAINNGSPNIINSEEPLLDEIIRHNKRIGCVMRGEQSLSNSKKRIWLDFEENGDKSIKSLLTKIKESDINTVWYAEMSQKGFNENYNVVMAVLNMQFPKRLFDVSTTQRLASLFEVYRSVLSVSDLTEVTDFWYNMGGNFAIKCSCANDGIVNVPGIGKYSKNEFSSNPKVIPYWIGTESIAGNEHRKAVRNKLISQIKTVDMMSRTEQAKSILGLIKQYGDNNL